MITLLSPQSAAHLHNYPGDHVENEKKKTNRSMYSVDLLCRRSLCVIDTNSQKRDDNSTYCKTPGAAASPGPRRPPRGHTGSFSPAAPSRKSSPRQPRSRWSETTAWTFRRRDAVLKRQCPHIPRLPVREGESFFFLLLGASCFFPLLAEKLWPSQSFSAGDQRRHVWRRSCRCSPGWKLHSCRSGLFSLGHRSQNNTA